MSISISDNTKIFHKMIVLVPFRNAGNYIIDCVSSVLGQEYKNYEVYLLDDASDDGTLDLIDEDLEHFHIVRNKERLGSLENMYQALVNLPIEDEDVVVLLDGDDYIFGEFAFQIVNNKYNENALLTYGQYITNYGFYDPCPPYTPEEFENLRQSGWKASHLKTFKYKLFKAFLQQDPNADNFRYNDGRFYASTSDQALMLPLMEVAGYENVVSIPNIVYCYRIHPNNDHQTDSGRKLQLEAVHDIRSRPSLKRMF
ncbi:glycosyltransferase family 2 protein [Chitinophaga sp. G-6-1-13]|uniref:Glycosyltransferase family 2 protein n=1 Tax=Chitinophaga fulva TaxID=2728842 RepID=A0A848GNF6_9BACT|nr:glycosyltransferase family A protein [Chitinophaga fulva]NML40006.1 glycosyltransferase family 2 protein [Chitinophaga fulva]